MALDAWQPAVLGKQPFFGAPTLAPMQLAGQSSAVECEMRALHPDARRIPFRRRCTPVAEAAFHHEAVAMKSVSPPAEAAQHLKRARHFRTMAATASTTDAAITLIRLAVHYENLARERQAR